MKRKVSYNITPREQEVLNWLKQGYTTQMVAEQMKISFNTVETHRKKLLQKFEARNTAELISKAANSTD
jgi:DNA-binding CsgD family transcriptional regulator